VKPFCPGLLLLGIYYFNYKFNFIIGLFRLSIPGSVMYVSRNVSISSRFSTLLAYNCSLYSFFFCIYGIECYFSSLISYFIWVLSLFFLVILALYPLEKPTFGFTGLFYSYLFLIYILFPFFIFIISFLLLTLDTFCCFKYQILRFFLRKACIAINFALRTIFFPLKDKCFT